MVFLYGGNAVTMQRTSSLPRATLPMYFDAPYAVSSVCTAEPEAAAEVGCLRSTLKLSAGWLETVLVGVVVIWARFYMHAELDKSAPLHTVIALAIAGVLGRFIQRAIDRAEARKIAQEQQALHNL